jgi:hypothetical protein
MSAYFNVKIDGQVVVTNILGQWSEQIALSFEKEMHRVVPNVSATRFAHLVSFDEWELSTPSVAPIVRRVAGWCVSQGMYVAAEVFSANVLKEYLINKATEEVKDHVTIRRFSSESDARKWLAEMGFETQTTQQLPT